MFAGILKCLRLRLPGMAFATAYKTLVGLGCQSRAPELGLSDPLGLYAGRPSGHGQALSIPAAGHRILVGGAL